MTERKQIISAVTASLAAAMIFASISLPLARNTLALAVVYEDHFGSEKFLYDDFDDPVNVCGEEVTLSAIEGVTKNFDYVLYEDGSWTLKYVTFSTYVDLDGNIIAKSKAITDEFGFADGIHHDNGDSITYHCHNN